MIQMGTMLQVADNSGARKIACILPLGGSAGSKASLGDIITAAVKEATPDGNIKKGKCRQGCGCADPQGISAARRFLYSLRSERGSSHQRSQ